MANSHAQNPLKNQASKIFTVCTRCWRQFEEKAEEPRLPGELNSNSGIVMVVSLFEKKGKNILHNNMNERGGLTAPRHTKRMTSVAVTPLGSEREKRGVREEKINLVILQQ